MASVIVVTLVFIGFSTTAARGDESIATCEAYVAAQPNSANAHLRLGLAYEAADRTLDAFNQYKAAIAIDPDFYVAWNNIGILYEKTQAYDDAIKSYQKALHINPKYLLCHINLGCAYETTNQNSKAIQIFRECAQQDPAYGLPMFEIGNVYMEMRQTANALTAYREQLKYTPANMATRQQVWACLTDLRRVDEARREAKADLQKATNYGEQLLFQGDLYSNDGRYADAAPCYLQSHNLNKDDYARYDCYIISIYASGDRAKARQLWTAVAQTGTPARAAAANLQLADYPE